MKPHWTTLGFKCCFSQFQIAWLEALLKAIFFCLWKEWKKRGEKKVEMTYSDWNKSTFPNDREAAVASGSKLGSRGERRRQADPQPTVAVSLDHLQPNAWISPHLSPYSMEVFIPELAVTPQAISGSSRTRLLLAQLSHLWSPNLHLLL